MSYYKSLFNLSAGDFDTFQLPNGANIDYILTCVDTEGTAEWRDIGTLGVTSITGTANQVLANGTTGTEQKGDVILTLPQDIGTTSSPTFSNLIISNLISSINGQSYDSTKWGQINSINQNLSTTSDVTFDDITCTTVVANTSAKTNILYGTQHNSNIVDLLNLSGAGSASTLTIANNSNLPYFGIKLGQPYNGSNRYLVRVCTDLSGPIFGSTSLTFGCDGTGYFSDDIKTGTSFTLGTTSITDETKFGYVNNMNQNVSSTSSPTFVNLISNLTGNVTGNLTGNVTGNLTGQVLTSAQNYITTIPYLDSVGGYSLASKWQYLANINQFVSTSNSPTFANVIVTSAVRVPDGTNNTCAVQRVSNAKTGMYFGGDTLGFSSNGTLVCAMDTSGGVAFINTNLKIINGTSSSTPVYHINLKTVGPTYDGWRWGFGLIDAESSTANGSNLIINSFNNSSSLIETCLKITRSTGNTTLKSLDITGNLSSINGTALATTVWPFVSTMNQNLATTSNPYFSTLAVGSGASASGCQLDVQSSSGESRIFNTGFGSGAVPRFVGRRTGGSQASPSQTVVGINLCILECRGYTSSNAYTSTLSNIAFQSTENFTSTAQGTNIIMSTVPNGSTSPATRLTIGQDGNVTINQNLSSINSTAISTSNWTNVATLNQALSSTSSPTFNNVTCTTLNNSVISSGNWTPTLSGDGTANYTLATDGVMFYTRNGDYVNISGSYTVTNVGPQAYSICTLTPPIALISGSFTTQVIKISGSVDTISGGGVIVRCATGTSSLFQINVNFATSFSGSYVVYFNGMYRLQ